MWCKFKIARLDSGPIGYAAQPLSIPSIYGCVKTPTRDAVIVFGEAQAEIPLQFPTFPRPDPARLAGYWRDCTAHWLAACELAGLTSKSFWVVTGRILVAGRLRFLQQ